MADHNHICAGIDTRLEYRQLLRPELLRRSVRGYHPFMGILCRAADPRKMLQTRRHLLPLEPCHHGRDIPGRGCGIGAIGTSLHDAALHIGQISHRCEIQIKSKPRKSVSDRHTRIISVLDIPCRPDVPRPIHLGSDVGGCHSGHTSALFVHGKEKGIFRI